MKHRVQSASLTSFDVWRRSVHSQVGHWRGHVHKENDVVVKLAPRLASPDPPGVTNTPVSRSVTDWVLGIPLIV